VKKLKRLQSDRAARTDWDARPSRVPRRETLPDVLERVVLRRHVKVAIGDVVITRERLPSLNPLTTLATPWRFCVRLFPDLQGSGYTAFQNAASAAEQLAAQRYARVVYVEDGTPTVLADYRQRS
jgi:hypothetical protein